MRVDTEPPWGRIVSSWFHLDRVGTTLGRFGFILTCLGRHLESLWGRLALVWLCISMQQYRIFGLGPMLGATLNRVGAISRPLNYFGTVLALTWAFLGSYCLVLGGILSRRVAFLRWSGCVF